MSTASSVPTQGAQAATDLMSRAVTHATKETLSSKMATLGANANVGIIAEAKSLNLVPSTVATMTVTFVIATQLTRPHASSVRTPTLLSSGIQLQMLMPSVSHTVQQDIHKVPILTVLRMETTLCSVKASQTS
jgi:hypothetical protein